MGSRSTTGHRRDTELKLSGFEKRYAPDVATDPVCRSRLWRDSAFFLGPGSGDGVKHLRKNGSGSGVTFHFGSSRSPRSLYKRHSLRKALLKFGCIDGSGSLNTSRIPQLKKIRTRIRI